MLLDPRSPSAQSAFFGDGASSVAPRGLWDLGERARGRPGRAPRRPGCRFGQATGPRPVQAFAGGTAHLGGEGKFLQLEPASVLLRRTWVTDPEAHPVARRWSGRSGRWTSGVAGVRALQAVRRGVAGRAAGLPRVAGFSLKFGLCDCLVLEFSERGARVADG